MATALPPLPSYITLTVLAAEISKVIFKNSSGSPNTFREPEDNNYVKVLDCTFLELTDTLRSFLPREFNPPFLPKTLYVVAMWQMPSTSLNVICRVVFSLLMALSGGERARRITPHTAAVPK